MQSEHVKLLLKMKVGKKPIGREIGYTELQSLRHNVCNALLLVSNVKLIVELQSLRHNVYNALLLVSNVMLIVEL